tara:strand:+ start:1093 stop:1536 length:444 start_codon:yes stop_codon:yes gene_type:complete
LILNGGYYPNQQQQTSNSKMTTFYNLPDEIMSNIYFLAAPTLDIELKDSIEIMGLYTSELWKKENLNRRIKLTFMNPNGDTRWVSINSANHLNRIGNQIILPKGWVLLSYTKNELLQILKNYYGGGKIPLISKIKTKKQIVQRIMSL